MSWRTVLVEDGELLKLKLDNIIIVKDEKEYTIPLSDISVIVVDGRKTHITTTLLAEITRHNVSLLTCDEKHHPIGIFHGFNGHSRASKILQRQIALKEEVKQDIWKQIVTFKIKNQLEVLKYFLSEVDQGPKKLESYLFQVMPGDVTNREGHAAKVYFNSLFGINFTRQDDNSIINAGLNYGYSVLRAHIARIVVGYGLCTMLGVFHKNEYNAFNLVDDLMEPFRPFVDIYVVIHLSNQQYFKSEHRQALVGLLTKRCIYNNQSCTVMTILDKYVCEFLNILEKNSVTDMTYPNVSRFEVL